MDEHSNPRKIADQFLEVATDVAGAGIGLTLGGVPGAIAGASAGAILKSVGLDVLSRALSHREKRRVSTVVDYAERRIALRLQKGDQPRSDGFFESGVNDRSAAAEIAEGVLIAAQREYEERKLPFIAHLMANISFDESVDRGQANGLVRIAERLSYRQLILISIFVNKRLWSLRDKDYSFERTAVSLVSVLTEILEIEQLSLLNASGSVLMGATNIAPARMNVEGMGATLYNLMNLSELVKIDLDEVATLLK